MFGIFVLFCLFRVLGWYCLEKIKLLFLKYGKISKLENGEINIGIFLKKYINYKEIV